jgi:hypothetical protein
MVIVWTCIGIVAIGTVIGIQRCRRTMNANRQAAYVPVGVAPIVQPGNLNQTGSNDVIVVPGHKQNISPSQQYVPPQHIPAQNYQPNGPRYQYNQQAQVGQGYANRVGDNSQNYVYNNQGQNQQYYQVGQVGQVRGE